MMEFIDYPQEKIQAKLKQAQEFEAKLAQTIQVVAGLSGAQILTIASASGSGDKTLLSGMRIKIRYENKY